LAPAITDVFPHFLMYSKTLLVLDSNVPRRTQIQYTLSLSGYKILEAASLREAKLICYSKKIHVDLVIADSGAFPSSAWSHWRSVTPVLLLISSSSKDQLQSPRNDFWRLPFDPKELVSSVASVLEQIRADEIASKQRTKRSRREHEPRSR